MGVDGLSLPVRALWQMQVVKRELEGKKIGDSPLPPCPFSKISRGRGTWGSLEEVPEQRGRDTLNVFLLGKEGSQPCSFLTHQAFLLVDSSSQPSLALLLSPRKTPRLQTQVKQIFVAASKFQRLFIARLSAPGAKSCS